MRTTTYSTTWRNKWLTAHAVTIDDMIEALEAAAQELRTMRDAGIWLDGAADDDYAQLVTTDPAAAEKFGLHEDEYEDEYYEDEEEDEDWLSGPNGKDPGSLNGHHGKDDH